MQSRSIRHRLSRLVALVIVAVVAPLLPPATDLASAQEPPAPERPWDIEIVAPDYVQTVNSPSGNNATNGMTPSISDDGRYATALRWTPEDTQGLYLQDLETGSATLIDAADPPTTPAIVSGDGSTVVYRKRSSGATSVEVHSVADGFHLTLPAPPELPDFDGEFYVHGVSDDGFRVLMSIRGGDQGQSMYLVDWTTTPIGFTTVFSAAEPMPENVIDISDARLSGDGTTVVAKVSTAQNVYGLQVWDLSGTSEFIAAEHYPVHWEAAYDISDDGQIIADMRGCDYCASSALRVHHRDTAVTDSWHPSDLPYDGFREPHIGYQSDLFGSSALALSGDGSTVLATVSPTALGGPADQVYALDVSSGEFSRATFPYTEDRTHGAVSAGAISDDGSRFVFLTDNVGLVAPGSVPDQLEFPRLYVKATRADVAAPSWPSGAAIGVDGVGASFVNVSWPAASDDRGVTGYRVFLDGVQVTETTADVTHAVIEGLDPGTAYVVSVQAFDATSAVSPFLVLGVTTEDIAAGVAPLAATAGDDGTVSLSWDAVDGAANYEVYRTIGAESVVVGQPVTTRFTDVGVPAETEVTYRVDSVVAGQSVPHTVDATVTTSALTTPSITWTAPRMRGRVGDLGAGATIDVTVEGQPGRFGDITVETEAGGTVTPQTVALSEVSAGVYEAAFVIPEGATTVTGVSGRLHDGSGHEATAVATGFPVAVAGSLRVTFDTDADLDGFRIDVSSRSATWSYLRDLTGRDPVVVPAPIADDMQVVVWQPNGDLSNRLSGIEIGSGVVTDVDMTVWHPAPLTVTVVDPEGDPVSDVRVDVSADGSPLATRGTTDADGVVVSDSWRNRQSVSVSISSDLVVMEKTSPTSITLVPGDNALEVVAPVVPSGVVTGTFTDSGGVGLSGATVTLTQIVSDTPIVRTVRTDENGAFTIGGLQRDGRIVASAGTLTGYADVTIGEDPVHVEIQGRSPESGVVELDLRVRGVGDPDWSAPIGVDWSTASHLRVHGEIVRPDGTTSRHVNLGRWEDSRTTITIHPGSRFRICADAREAGGGAGCSDPVTAGVQGTNYDVDLRLQAHGRLELSIVNADGTPYDESSWITISSLEERFSDRVAAEGGRLDTNLPHAGGYQVVVQHGQRMFSETTLTVVPDAITPATIQLPPTTGPFVGDGNGLSTKGEVLPGDTVILRGQYRASADVAGATYSLQLPPGWTPISTGAVVDGTPTEIAVDGNLATFSLGDIVSGDEGVIHVPVEIPGSAHAGATHAAVASVVDASGGRHPVGATGIEIAGVSIDGPETVYEPSVVVNGRAPAGSLITIAEGEVTLGMAVAGPSGRWEARLELPERPEGSTYHLHAIGDDGTVSATEPIVVTYDPNRARLSALTVSQDGRSVTIAPTGRTQRFPFVIVSSPLKVTLTFDRPEAVTSATVSVGGRRLDAVRQSDGSFVAEARPFSMGDEGPISVRFESESVPLDADDPDLIPDDPDALGSLLPPGFDRLVNPHAEETVSGSSRTLRVSADLPGLASGGQEPPTLSVTITDAARPDYVPSPRAVADAEEIGLPLYEPQVSLADDGLSGEATGFYEPQEGSSGPIPGVNFFSPVQVDGVRRSIVIAWEITDKANTVNDVASLWKGEKYDKLDRLRNRIDALQDCVSPYYDRQYLYDYVDAYAKEALATDLVSAGLMAAGFAAGTVTFGFGFAVSVGGWLLEKALAYKLDTQIDRTNDTIDEIRDYYGCDAEADPDYIYDPSGFVYEATEDNRLAGVTTTVLYAPAPEGPWEVWDAGWFLQENPLITDDEGRYAWDVPKGFWRVKYEKEGYVTGFSEVLEVLPPHFDVNEGLVSTTAPAVDDVDGNGAIEVTFTQPMKVDWVTSSIDVTAAAPSGTAMAGPVALMATASDPVTGTVTAIDAATTPDGDQVATIFRFTPATTLDDGTSLDVTIHAGARNYGDRPMLDDHVANIVYAAAQDPDPDNPDPDNPDPNDPDPDNPDPDPNNPDPSDPDPNDPGSSDPGSNNGGPINTPGVLPGAPNRPGATGGSSSLPVTGSSLTLLELAALLLAAGTSMHLIGRRRARSR